MPKTAYNKNFFDHHKDLSLNSAQVIVPLVLELVQPKSVIDVGCGSGAFLSVFEKHHVTDILGVDGDYVKTDSLLISPNHFKTEDLKKPLRLPRTFDLAVSLEVGEHLPESSADIFVESLSGLAPVILFSAAVPHQGGTFHINEQWPDYWAKKFSRKNYIVIDCIRPRIWQHPQVSWWYAQNTLIFVRQDQLVNYPNLQLLYRELDLSYLSIIHPSTYLRAYNRSKIIDFLKRCKNSLFYKTSKP